MVVQKEAELGGERRISAKLVRVQQVGDKHVIFTASSKKYIFKSRA
jgi:hypothetical protein